MTKMAQRKTYLFWKALATFIRKDEYEKALTLVYMKLDNARSFKSNRNAHYNREALKTVLQEQEMNYACIKNN